MECKRYQSYQDQHNNVDKRKVFGFWMEVKPVHHVIPSEPDYEAGSEDKVENIVE